MIPIPYGYTGANEFNLSKYQYVEGADIIFDFGNPITTGSIAGSGYASNVITDKSSVILNLASQRVGGLPTYGPENGGSLFFQIGGLPYCVWNYGLTTAQTTIVFFKPNADLLTSGMPAAGNATGLNRQNALRMNTSWIGGNYNVSSSVFSSADANPTVNFSINMDTQSYGGWTMSALSTNGSNLHQFWQNNATGSNNTTVITRSDSNNTDPKVFGKTALVDAGISGQLIAIMQYPRQLNQREIKQTFQLFKQRLT